MSTTAQTWFYTEPEHEAYLISERLNSTFWQARAVSTYWKTMRAEPPFLAHGYQRDDIIELEWVPGEWLALRAPREVDVSRLVKAISQRVLAFPATLSCDTADGQQVMEWHRDGGDRRWSELQGRYEVSQLKRLK